MCTARRVGKTISGILCGLVCLCTAFYLIGVYQFNWTPFPFVHEIGMFKLLATVLIVCWMIGELLQGKFVGALILCIPLACMYRFYLGITMSIGGIIVVGLLICIAINLFIPDSLRRKIKYGYREDHTRVYDDEVVVENINAGENRVVDISTTFSGTTKYIESTNLRVVNIRASFSGVTVHLERAIVDNNVLEVNISEEFAGVTLIVPNNWVVENQMDTFLGGVEDDCRVYNSTDGVRVILRGKASFAGVHIKRI